MNKCMLNLYFILLLLQVPCLCQHLQGPLVAPFGVSQQLYQRTEESGQWLSILTTMDLPAYLFGGSVYHTSFADVLAKTLLLMGDQPIDDRDPNPREDGAILTFIPDAESGATNDTFVQCWEDVMFLRDTLEDHQADVRQAQGCLYKDPMEFDECIEEVQIKINMSSWASKVIDSWGKIPSAVIDLSTKWMGDWHECLSINEVSGNKSFVGKYFTAGLQILIPGPNKTFEPLPGIPGVYYGFCAPDSCSAIDMYIIWDIAQHIYPKLKQVNLTGFAPRPRDVKVSGDGKFIATVCCLSVWLIILIAATSYDVLVNTSALKQPENTNHTEAIAENDTTIKSTLQSSNTDSLLAKILVALSINSNVKKIFSIEKRSGSIDCVHGIRFLSMAWIILGHTYYYALLLFDPQIRIVDILKQKAFQPIANGTNSVDTFFLLSGFLVSYLLLRETDKTNGRFIKSVKTWILYYFHRIIRLTPVYMITMGILVAIFKYIGSGPFWPYDGVEPGNCKYWWTNLLYVNNLAHASDMCMGHTWYLANDMQLYIVAPLLLLPLYWFAPAGIVAGIALMIGSCIARGYVIGSNRYPPNDVVSLNTLGLNTAAQNGAEIHHVYMAPWMRCGPYICGIILGYLLNHYNKKPFRIHIVLNVLLWLGSVASCCAVVYGFYHWTSQPIDIPKWVIGLYGGLCRTAWAIAVSWMIFACATGHGGIINYILSCPAFFPFSRLTYCAYLIHPYVMMGFYYNHKKPIYFDGHDTMVYYFIANLVISYALAGVLSLAFESTVMNLEKVLLERFTGRPTKPPNPDPDVNHNKRDSRTDTSASSGTENENADLENNGSNALILPNRF